MEKILRIFGKEYGNINQAALLLGCFAFFSQILGLFRDRSLAHFIGPSPTLDIYYAAFRVPDLIFISVASLASITVLIPFILGRMSGDKVTDEARKYVSDIFSVFFVLMIFFSIIAYLLMPYLSSINTPGFTSEMQSRVVELSRIMLLSPILLGLSNIFGTVAQLFRKFFIYALSPIFYNLGIIAGILFLYPAYGIYGLAIGVSLGAFLHFLIQALASAWSGFTPRFSWSINFSAIKDTVLISLPRTLGLSLNNIALILLIAFASYLQSGSISIFNLSLNLQTVPLGIIGLSYAVAAFPTLTKSFAKGEMNEFKAHLIEATRAIVFWSLPITFLFIVLRAQIVRVVLGSGVFSWENTRLAAASLAVFAVSFVAQGLIALFARAYYAGGNTKRPLFINFISSLSIVFFAALLLWIFNNFPVFRYFIESLLKIADLPGTEIVMLPLAYSLGTLVNFILLWFYTKKELVKDEPFLLKSFFQSLGASFFIGLVAYLSLNALAPVFGTQTFWGIFLQGLLSGILGITAGILVLYLLKNQELKDLAQTLHTKFWKVKVVAPPQEGL